MARQRQFIQSVIIARLSQIAFEDHACGVLDSDRARIPTGRAFDIASDLLLRSAREFNTRLTTVCIRQGHTARKGRIALEFQDGIHSTRAVIPRLDLREIVYC